MKRIQLYFMLRNKVLGEWRSTVHLDFGRSAKEWEGAVQGDGDAQALLHVGMGYPNRSDVEDVFGGAYPGRVLATASARGSMPLSYACARFAVGTLPQSLDCPEVDVYLVTNGFGYSVGKKSGRL